MSFFSDIANSGLSAIDPQYAARREQLHDSGSNLKSIGTIALAAAAAFTTLSLAFAITGSAIGFVFFLLPAAGCGYVGYNAHQIGSNVLQVARNPLNYPTRNSLHRRLEEGTFGASCAIDIVCNVMQEELNVPHRARHSEAPHVQNRSRRR